MLEKLKRALAWFIVGSVMIAIIVIIGITINTVFRESPHLVGILLGGVLTIIGFFWALDKLEII